MRYDPSHAAQEFLDIHFAGTCCSWCRDFNCRLYGKKRPLCSHCGLIAKQLRAAERALRTENNWLTERNHQILEFAKQSAQNDGVTYGCINERDISGLDVEHELSFLSRRRFHKDLYHGTANFFTDFFTLPQRRLLFFELSKMSRKVLREGRRNNAHFQYTRQAAGT